MKAIPLKLPHLDSNQESSDPKSDVFAKFTP